MIKKNQISLQPDRKFILYVLFVLLAFFTTSCHLTEKYVENTEKTYDELGQVQHDVELDSSTIHWRKVGNGGENLVLIQGFGPLPMVQWKKITKELYDKYTIYIPDLVYFGQSTSRYAEYSPKFQARQIYLSFKKLNIENAYIAGLSYGGLVAELFAHNHPEITKGLILIDALSVFYDRSHADSLANAYGAASMREFLLPKNGKMMKKLFQASYAKPFCVPGVFLNGPVEYLYSDKEGRLRNLIDFMYDHKEEIRNWDIAYSGPVQIIWGNKDIIIPVRYAHMLKAFYPDAKLDFLKNSGHVPNFEKDEMLANAIIAFIERERKTA